MTVNERPGAGPWHPTVRVLLVDDHPIVREGLSDVLDGFPGVRVVAAVESAAKALLIYPVLRPDIVLMDLSMPQMDGAAATRVLLSQDKRARILIMSMHDDAVSLRRAAHCGALGYVLKDSAPEDLLTALRRTAAGQACFGPGGEKLLRPGMAGGGRSGAAVPPRTQVAALS